MPTEASEGAKQLSRKELLPLGVSVVGRTGQTLPPARRFEFRASWPGESPEALLPGKTVRHAQKGDAMDKLTLNLDDLKVESFDTIPEDDEAGKGTVLGYSCPTCGQPDHTCQQSCYGTCAVTCPQSCGGTCGEICSNPCM